MLSAQNITILIIAYLLFYRTQILMIFMISYDIVLNPYIPHQRKS